MKFFNEITVALKNFQGLFLNRLDESNILEQYQFCNIMNLVYTSIQTIERLSIGISSILQDKNDYNEFVETLENTLRQINSIADNLDNLRGRSKDDELLRVWQECGSISKNIQFSLLNFASDSNDSLFTKIEEMIVSFKKGEFNQSQSVFLKCLSMNSTLDSMCKGAKTKETIAMLLNLFEVLADKKTTKIISHLKSIPFDNELEEFTYDEFEETSEKFMRAIANKVLMMVACNLQKTTLATEENNKKKKEDLEKHLVENRSYYSVIFNKMTECSTKILEAAESATKIFHAKALIAHKDELSKQKKENEGEKTKASKKFDSFQTHLSEVACKNNKFFDYIHIYVAAITLEKTLDINGTLFNMCKRLSFVLEAFSRYSKVELAQSELSVDHKNTETIYQVLSEDLIKFITWSLSKVSYGLIKPQSTGDKAKTKPLQRIIRSDLLSGGISLPQIHNFSKNSKETILKMIDIIQDPELAKHLQTDPIKTTESVSLNSIIHAGTSAPVDALIELLHWNYEKLTSPFEAGVVTKEEIMFTRPVFACAIKFSNLSQ
jgi:hypothetical protein